MTSISRLFTLKKMIYCDNASHIIGFLKSIIRRHSFSKKNEIFIILLDNIRNGVLTSRAKSGGGNINVSIIIREHKGQTRTVA